MPFLLFSFLAITSLQTSTVRLNSPDETANYFFSVNFAREGKFGYPEALLNESKGFLHPRSMTVSPKGDAVVPVGFLGMPLLHGMLARFFGTEATLFLTPFVAVISAFFFYSILIRIMSRSISLLSSFLLLIHPAYWYNASRSMLPNVLFVGFLIIGTAFSLGGLRKQGREELKFFFLAACGGFFFGLSLMLRLSEAPWIAVSALFLIAIFIRRIAWKRAVFWFLSFCAPIAFLLYWNAQVYGHPLFFGYQTGDILPAVQAFDNAVDVIRTLDVGRLHQIQENAVSVGAFLTRYLMPFGFHPELFFTHFWDYGVSLFWWLSLPACVGFALMIRSGISSYIREKKPAILAYCFLFFLLLFWLVSYYGSWKFYDNISKDTTIGSSYVRYWLILYVMSIPFIAMALHRIASYANGIFRTVLRAGIIGCMIFFSFQSVFWQSEESIFPVMKNIRSYEKIAQKVFSLTPDDAIIVSPRSDKIFFPNRKVAQHLEDFHELELLIPIVKRAPIYYYGFWDAKTIAFVNKKYFFQHHLQLSFVSEIANNERLYHLAPL